MKNNANSFKKLARITPAKSLLPALLILTAACFAQTGGQYELSWSTIDAGGGTSSGGVYELKGTIGQYDAAYSEGGDYQLLGGFWPGGPLCAVDFEDFAKFAELWLVTGQDLPADLYEDEYDIVDLLDLEVFVDYWLCFCPLEWSLK